jgi:medium-chain acyl-[acyl-carrier-protein] hydrolase
MTSRWVMRWRSAPEPRLRLLCFAYAGGGASIYKGWSDQFAPDVEVCGIQLPGRESRIGEPPFARMDALVGPLADGLKEVLDAPFVTFGHSLGGLVSFDLARHLRRSGLPLPSHMIVSGRRPPQLPHRDAPIHQLPREEFLAAIRGFNGTDPRVFQHPELLDLAIPILRADLGISETYRYLSEPPLDCPITALYGSADPSVTRTEATAWGVQTSGPFDTRAFPGDHFFLRSAQPQLLAELHDLLNRIR